jgi:methionyl-tRNA synthetase
MNREILLIIIAVAWSLPWKGFALWKSARKGDSLWFVVLLLVNTLAILEILYIFIFSERRKRRDIIPR